MKPYFKYQQKHILLPNFVSKIFLLIINYNMIHSVVFISSCVQNFHRKIQNVIFEIGNKGGRHYEV